MATTTLANIIVATTRDAIYSTMLSIASALGLSTETWIAGDPTRTLFDATSRMQAAHEAGVVAAIKSGFITLAKGQSKTLAAKYIYNVDRVGATYADCTVRLTNAGSLPYTWDPNDLIAVDPVTGATFRNSTGGTLLGGGTLDLTFVAESSGTKSNAGVGDVNALVTPIAKIAIANTTAASAFDEESDEALEARCLAKLGSLSPNGPSDAYHYVATTPELTGNSETSRTRVVGDSTTGSVTVFIASASGGVTVEARDAVEDAIETWATPLTINVSVERAEERPIPITYALWVYDSIGKTTAEIEQDVEGALLSAFALRPIGGDDGIIYREFILAAILQAVAPHGYRVTLTLPAGNTTLTDGQVATVGTITVDAINLVGSP